MQSGVLIILPVLNEAENISTLLSGIGRELSRTMHAICIIDDGSIDGTVEKVLTTTPAASGRIHLIRRKKERWGCQRGGALKCGLDWGLQDPSLQIFVEIDGDLSHRVEELTQGVNLVASGQADVAIASKYLPGSRVIGRTGGRKFVSWICSVATSLLLDRSVKDYSNGYRFYTRSAAELVAAHRVRYGSPIYLSEVLALWLREGLKVMEFPSTYIGRNEGLSKLRWIDLMKASLAVIEIASRYHFRGFERLPTSNGNALPSLSSKPLAARSMVRDDK